MSFFSSLLSFFSPLHEHRTDFFGRFLALLLGVNVFSVLLEPSLSDTDILIGIHFFQGGSILFMTIEYFLRIASATLFLPKKSLRGFFSPLFLFEGIILIFGGLHFFFPEILDLRVFWIFRIFHFWENVPFLYVLLRIFRDHKKVMVFSLSIMASIIIIFSTLIFFAEHGAQPDKFPTIFHSMWFAVVTFFTVGYGDIYPITPLGKILVGVSALFGIAIFWLPITVIGSAFFNEILSQEREKRTRLEKRLEELEKKYRGSHSDRSVEKKIDSDLPTLLRKK